MQRAYRGATGAARLNPDLTRGFQNPASQAVADNVRCLKLIGGGNRGSAAMPAPLFGHSERVPQRNARSGIGQLPCFLSLSSTDLMICWTLRSLKSNESISVEKILGMP